MEICKTYCLDMLIGGGAIFELKAVQSLMERHRRQLMQYLFLLDLPHGKLVNLRPERVDHEFVNNVLRNGKSITVATAWHVPAVGGMLSPGTMYSWSAGRHVLSGNNMLTRRPCGLST